MEIVRLQFFTEDEIKELRGIIDEGLAGRQDDRQVEPVQPSREPGAPPERREGVVSDPDFAGRH